ncbi:MAG: aldolase catalytic domain-containing protein [Ruminococcus flavefaciens]|nr:aldolase catalytic domain-containing protein [Ruminococcus flavefaciens]
MYLLDCTLRDGGYVNDWKFGYDTIINIYERLVSAKVDMIEVGFIDASRPYDKDRSIFPDTAGVKRTFDGFDKGKSFIVGMIDYGTCPIENVELQKDSFLDGIRVIFKKEKMHPAIEFCRQIKEKGYKIFVQAVSITSYDNESFSELLGLVNKLEPDFFSLVDTYGLLHKEDLHKYLQMADEGLEPNIGLGYHAHNNFQLAYSNCIEFLEQSMERKVLVDASLYGMGKSAGNAPIELLSMFMNDHCGKAYQVEQLLEAIDVSIMDIYRKMPWGYAFKFYLSASNDCHPNYVAYLQEKRKLSVKSISEILDAISPEKKLLYDVDYIEQLYLQYQARECEDRADRERLKELLLNKKEGRPVLLLGPGNSIKTQQEKIRDYIETFMPIVIAVNFLPEEFSPNALFISNAKRYVQLFPKLMRISPVIPVIGTSNVTSTEISFEYTLNYAVLLDERAWVVDNPLVMLLKLLKQLGMDKVFLAGFDGFQKAETANYVNENMEYEFTQEKALQLNRDTEESLKRQGLDGMIRFVTDTLYQL